MVGTVMSGQADIVAADLTMTSKRAEVLHFTVPYMTAHVTVLLKKERRRGGKHGDESGGVRTLFFVVVQNGQSSIFFIVVN
jgi:ABC-type amino acid transport substrate-binding protein